MRADLSTVLVVRAAQALVAARKRMKETVPLGPMVISETPSETARREMTGTPTRLRDLAKKLGIKER